ncbi:MAG: hypothetical protein ABMA25_08245 [Ilumatobacteraceae bacterium]
MSEQLEHFGDAIVAVVTFATPERLAAYRAHLRVRTTLLSDIDLRLYGLVGARRGSRREIWSLGTLRMYAGLLRRGRRLRRPTEDVHQLGADLVVGRDGTVRYLALPPSPDARPPISELIAALD